MSLEEIESLTAADVPADQLRGMLTMKASDLGRAIDVQQARMRSIESRIDQIDAGDEDIDLLTKHIDAQAYLSVRTRFDSIHDAAAFAGRMFEAAAPFVGDSPSPSLLGIWHGDWSDKGLDLEVGFAGSFLTDELEIDGGRILAPSRLPAVDVVSTVRVGLPDVAHGVYAGVGRWFATHDAKIGGPIRELFVQRPAPGIAPVVEVQFPIA